MNSEKIKLKNALIKASNNFTIGIQSATLAHWEPKYDANGNLKNSDPNIMDGKINLDGKDYFFTKKNNIVNIRLNKNESPILTINLLDEK